MAAIEDMVGMACRCPNPRCRAAGARVEALPHRVSVPGVGIPPGLGAPCFPPGSCRVEAAPGALRVAPAGSWFRVDCGRCGKALYKGGTEIEPLEETAS
jgi:hypothetical protein